LAVAWAFSLLSGSATALAGVDAWFYGAPEDHSRFVSAQLLDDGRTCLVSAQRVVYRRARGIAAFPDGGVPKYIEDLTIVSAVDVASGRVRRLARLENTEWAPGSGALSIQAICGDRALMTQGGQWRDRRLGSRTFWLTLSDGHVQMVDFAQELARHGRAPRAQYVLTSEGVTLHVTGPLESSGAGIHGHRDAELWLRDPRGAYTRVGAGTYYGCARTHLYFYDPAGRRLYSHNWTTGITEERPRNDPEYVAGLEPDGPCGALRPKTRACRAELDGTLVLETRLNGRWERTPIPVRAESLR
jgi:hypothetical protein